jgi:metal-dependent amidase/aminoacylase/carboxypeptidase family protein
VRSYKPGVRQHLLDGIARIAKGEAIAAGMPDALMPVVKVADESTPATFNTPKLSSELTGVFEARFGKDRVLAAPPTMGGEDFSRYWLADQSKESVIFWVGGVPQGQWDAAEGDASKLPSLHSPFWAPDAEKVIATATEAMTAAALHVLAKPQ